jgi:protease I
MIVAERNRRNDFERRSIMASLNGFRVAVIATDGFEEQELTEPVRALKDAGAQVTILSPKSGQLQAFRHMEKGITVPMDEALSEADADEFDGVVLPGGALNADFLRVLPELQSFLQTMQDAHKPTAAICHAPWELISAGLVQGRTLTSYHTIQDDIRNAGGNWIDQEVVEDDNRVTSRQPDDLPAFNETMLRLFSQSMAAARH